MSVPISPDDLLFSSPHSATDCATNSNDYILGDPVSLEDGTESGYPNSTEWTDPLESEVEDKKDINIIIKQESLDSDCGDSISYGDATSATYRHEKECLDVDVSKELVDMIKLETLEDSGLESQEEILPDLPNALFPVIKDEQIILNLHNPKSDAFQESVKKEGENLLNEKVMRCNKTEASSSSVMEEIKSIKLTKEIVNKKQLTTSIKIPTKTSFKSRWSKRILEAIKQNDSLEAKEEGEHTICKSSVETLESEVSDDSLTKTIKHEVHEYTDDNDDLSERLDEKDVSDQSICCGSIFCDCNSCKAFRKSLLTTKLKPTGNYKYNCGLCKKKFLRKDCLKKHELRKCNTIKPFSCDFCAIGFTVKSSLKDHLSKCHSSTKVSKKKLKLRCDLCDKYFSFKSGLRTHMRNIHFLQKMNVTYTCELCQKVYRNKKGLNLHKLHSHSGEEFECGHCAKIYNSKRQLSYHIQSTHFQTRFECGRLGCEKVFSSAVSLRNHELSFHLQLLPARFICETCGKSFGTKFSLQNHILIHTDEKLYICQVCGKSFRTESNLEQHSRTHSDKRPFSCDLCPMAFRIKHHLRQHMSVHGMASTSVKRKQKSN